MNAQLLINAVRFAMANAGDGVCCYVMFNDTDASIIVTVGHDVYSVRRKSKPTLIGSGVYIGYKLMWKNTDGTQMDMPLPEWKIRVAGNGHQYICVEQSPQGN